MNAKRFFYIAQLLCFSLFLLTPSVTAATRPQWVTKGEGPLNAQRTNDTYYFKVIQSFGHDLSALKQNSINTLADYIGKENQISGQAVTELESNNVDGSVSDREHFRMTFKNDFTTEVFQASLVDDYWEADGRGEYHYCALYAVSEKGRQPRFEVTRSYGALPAVMSVIPGAGQLYKGQKVKGFCMIGGAVLGAGAIILCENRRAYNETRIAEQPQFARTYSTRRDNWATGRNIAIGATAALMAWSIIDAAVTPGATRIKVTPTSSFALRPAALPSSDGLAFGAALSFSF